MFKAWREQSDPRLTGAATIFPGAYENTGSGAFRIDWEQVPASITAWHDVKGEEADAAALPPGTTSMSLDSVRQAYARRFAPIAAGAEEMPAEPDAPSAVAASTSATGASDQLPMPITSPPYMQRKTPRPATVKAKRRASKGGTEAQDADCFVVDQFSVLLDAMLKKVTSPVKAQPPVTLVAPSSPSAALAATNVNVCKTMRPELYECIDPRCDGMSIAEATWCVKCGLLMRCPSPSCGQRAFAMGNFCAICRSDMTKTAPGMRRPAADV